MQSCADFRLGRFELLQELGRGLNSTAYLAQDPELERRVVIKLLGKGTLNQEELVARVRSVSELAHVGIARIFDLGYTEPAGDPYLVMEYVEGETLEAVLAKGKLPESEALALTVELLDALSYAHERRMCHHNLKPSNLILTRDGHLKITDFGDIRRSGVTTFMAPERLKSSGDERSDLFSVGVILYLMLSGFRPFQGNTDATIGFKLVHQHPVPVAVMDMKLTPELDLVVGRLMAKIPDERYQTAEEARRDIVAIQKAKNLGVAAPCADEPVDAHLALMESLGFPGTGRASDRKKPEITKSARFWRLGASLVGACIAIASLAVFKPLIRATPPAPAVSVHLEVPVLASEKHESVAQRKTEPKTDEPHLVAVSGMAKAQESRGAIPPTKGELVAVPIELRQPFRECLMSIWVDKKLTYKNRIRGEKKARFLHLGTTPAEYLTMVQMPVGDHSVRVEVSSVDEKYEASGSVAANFSKTNDQKLRITAEKDHTQLQLQLN